MADRRLFLTRQRVHLADAVYLVAKKLYADSRLTGIGQVDLYHIAPHAKFVAHEVYVISLVLQGYQAAHQFFPFHLHTLADADDHAAVINWVAQGIDARYAGHDDDIAPLAQGRCGRMAQAVNFVVDGAVFFDIGICGGNVGLRLVIVVIAYEILHRIVGKKLFEFCAKLCGQRFIVRQHQRGAVYPRNDIGHGKGFARARDAQQRLAGIACAQAGNQLIDGLGLIARGLIGGNKFKVFHGVRHLYILSRNPYNLNRQS